MGSRQNNEETRGVLEGEVDDDDEEEQERERGSPEEEVEREGGGGGEGRDGGGGVRERPPSYQDAFFFPVLIIHGEESCHAGDDM